MDYPAIPDGLFAMLIDQGHRKTEGECEGAVELKNLFCGEKPDIVSKN